MRPKKIPEMIPVGFFEGVARCDGYRQLLKNAITGQTYDGYGEEEMSDTEFYYLSGHLSAVEKNNLLFS